MISDHVAPKLFDESGQSLGLVEPLEHNTRCFTELILSFLDIRTFLHDAKRLLRLLETASEEPIMLLTHYGAFDGFGIGIDCYYLYRVQETGHPDLCCIRLWCQSRGF